MALYTYVALAEVMVVTNRRLVAPSNNVEPRAFLSLQIEPPE